MRNREIRPLNLLTEPTHWIFLRGLARHSAHWGPFAEVFRREFPLATVEMLDAAGNGTERGAKSFLSVEESVEDLRERSLAMRETQKSGRGVFLFSISLGSMMATHWAHRHPEEIEGMVLINTSDRGNSWFFERLRPENYLNILTILTQPDNNCLREDKIMAMTAGGFTEAHRWAEEFAKLPTTSVENFARQLLAGTRYRFPVRAPKTQILLLASRHDQLVNSVCTEKIARRWNLPAQFHPRAGHDLPLWAPDWVCARIREAFGKD